MTSSRLLGQVPKDSLRKSWKRNLNIVTLYFLLLSTI